MKASRMKFRTTVRAFDPRRSPGLLGLMKVALAFLEGLEVAKQFRLEILGQIDLFQRFRVLGVGQLLELLVGRLVVRTVHFPLSLLLASVRLLDREVSAYARTGTQGTNGGWMIPPGLHMRFPCSRKYAIRARRSFTTYLTSIQVDAGIQHDLETAVGEAIANAIEHGYPKARWFQIRCRVTDNEIVTEVEDDGPGFQADAKQPAPGQTRGFGFGIMRSLVDELYVLKNGRLVRFMKRLAPVIPNVGTEDTVVSNSH